MVGEGAHVGPFKLIRTVEEYWEAIHADQFLGSAWCFERPRRLEVNELVSYIGQLTTDRNGIQSISNIEFVLKIPKIPMSLLDIIIEDFRQNASIERIFQVRWDTLAKEYVLVRPTESKESKASINYSFKNIPYHLKPILEIHSHNTMPAFFSKTDDNDELLKGFYGVIGNIDQEYPDIKLRVGMEGFFTEISVEDLFEGGNANE